MHDDKSTMPLDANDGEETSEHIAQIFDAAIKDSFQRLPPPPCKVSVEGDAHVLTYEQQTVIGKLEVRFTPSEGLNETAQAAAKDLLRQTLALRVKNKSLFLHEADEAEGRKEGLLKAFSIWFEMYFLHCLSNNLTLVLQHTTDDAALIAAAQLQSLQVQTVGTIKGIKNISVKGVPESLKFNLERQNKEKRGLLEKYLEVIAPVRFEGINRYYDALLPIWQDIQRIATTHGDAWRDMMKAKYGGKIIVFSEVFDRMFDNLFADDLLKRIAGERSKLSEAEQTLIEDRDDSPSTIALEHSARLCGAYRGQFTPRYLFQKVTELRTAEQFSKTG
jgi:hypothetical protein